MDSRNHKIMYLDGSHQANDTPGTVFVHRRIGFLPTALHPAPKDALVVGLGGGATAGAVSIFPGVSVDVVELSDTVVRGAGQFRHINFDLLRKPGVHLRVDDGRNHMLLTRKRYDVVTADIILPRHAGAGNLYSADYFKLVRNVLKDDGLAVQWVSPDSTEEYNLITRTFLSVFPQSTLWGDGSLLIGTKRPLKLRRSDYERKLADPAYGEALRQMGIGTFDRLASLYVAGPDALHRHVGAGPILTDDRPMVEYFLTLDAGTPVDLSGVRGDISEILAD
jgi:spermidine synthase